MPSSPHPPQTTTTTTLESDLLTHLASTTALEDIHSTLLSTLQRTGWTERIRKLATELLRAGRCERFDEVVDAVVATAEGRIASSSSLFLDQQDYAHNHKYDHDHDTENGGGEDIDVRIPSAVVEQGVRAIKEVLREVAVRDDESDLLDGSEDGSEGSEPSGKVKREDTSGRGNGSGNGSAFEGGTSAKEKKKGKGGKSGR
ncbi:uncharacterized protein BDW47DRAFT_126723 [Aspergillus candidus]|uniref:Uncharacterized protein n=1 Tax=Aspergillus candidus TaxID=41067 RepID=A0A2I2F8U5_ASPCN|nr:hypothetical protein BDW47DRAFT_126723 [Aspergillus candidus]PLB37043.1 hypothetical protein BDW47DRAFT_126723 [Aspergillus candidus]